MLTDSFCAALSDILFMSDVTRWVLLDMWVVEIIVVVVQLMYAKHNYQGCSCDDIYALWDSLLLVDSRKVLASEKGHKNSLSELHTMWQKKYFNCWTISLHW